MKKLSPKAQKIRLAVYAVLGAIFTFALSLEFVQKHKLLQAMVFMFAAAFVFLFLRIVWHIGRKEEKRSFFAGVKKIVSVFLRRVGALLDRVGLLPTSQDKVFLEGKNERKFFVEIRTGGGGQTHRKAPKLPKNASDRQKIRYEYASYVFKRDKNVSASLTPSEVGEKLYREGDDASLIPRYNEARYTEEK